jgi:ATP-dependent 26S proteasome regulatory subunit
MLESALASRPGRIDQAIEFPLPDEEGRRKLIKLYSGNIQLSEEIENEVAKRTSGVSAAFIRELMRRASQYYLQDTENAALTAEHIDSALQEMVLSGGKLNLKLLGGGEISLGDN